MNASRLPTAVMLNEEIAPGPFVRRTGFSPGWPVFGSSRTAQAFESSSLGRDSWREDNATLARPANHRLPVEQLRLAIESRLSLKNGCFASQQIARLNEEVADRLVTVKPHIGDALAIGGPRYRSEAVFGVGTNNLLRFGAVRAHGPDLASERVAAVKIESAKATHPDGASDESNARAVR